MARRATRAESEQRWRERVSRWQGSGLSAAAVAAKEQVSVASLYQWRRRLRGATVATAAARCRGTCRGCASSTT
jgi:transposase